VPCKKSCLQGHVQLIDIQPMPAAHSTDFCNAWLDIWFGVVHSLLHMLFSY